MLCRFPACLTTPCSMGALYVTGSPNFKTGPRKGCTVYIKSRYHERNFQGFLAGVSAESRTRQQSRKDSNACRSGFVLRQIIYLKNDCLKLSRQRGTITLLNESSFCQDG